MHNATGTQLVLPTATWNRSTALKCSSAVPRNSIAGLKNPIAATQNVTERDSSAIITRTC